MIKDFWEEIITTKEGVILDDFSKKITYCFGDGNTDELSVLHFEKAHTYFLNGIEILETQFLYKENIEIFYDAYFGEIIENYGAEDTAQYFFQRADEISKVADFI